MFKFSAFQDRPVFVRTVSGLKLCNLEKKTVSGKNKGKWAFFLAKKYVIFLQFVNIYIISPTKQNFVMNL